MNEELSYQFDILYNNTMSNQAPGLNSYEKSTFLTKAEIEVIKNHFNAKSNKLVEGFDDSPKRHIDFSSLIRTYGPSQYENNLQKATLPDKMLCILNETILEDGVEKIVVPLNYDEYDRLRSKPYKLPLKNQVWRIIQSNNPTYSIKFIGHSSDTSKLKDYKIRYIKLPNPIMVGDTSDYLLQDAEEPKDKKYITLTTGDTFPYWEENSLETDKWQWPEVNIPKELIPEVIQRAVELAKAAWMGDINTTLTIGARSE